MSEAPQREELGEFLLEHRHAAFAFALSLTGNGADAEDACQEAFLKILRSPAGVRPGGGFRAWLFAAVHSAAIDAARAERARRERERSSVMPERVAEGSSPEAAERHAAVRGALEALESRYRLPVMLHYCQGLSQAEVAAVLDIPEGTASANISRGLERLRGVLAGAGFSGAALAAALGGLAWPAAPASLETLITGALAGGAAAAGQGAGVVGAQHAAPLLKGGLLMKIGLGFAAVGLAAGGTLWAVGGKAADRPSGKAPAAPPAAAAPEGPKAGHKDFEYTTLGKTAFIEHVAFLGAVEDVDGPGREAMHRGIFCLTGDAAGNLYFYETGANCIRALRKRDGRVFTLSGTRYICSGLPGKGGAADGLKLFHECFIAMPSLAAVGDPLDGEGSLYVTDDTGAVVRLWREKGVWRYELVAGLGKGKPANGATALDVSFSRSALVASEKGEIGLIAGNAKSAALYWLRDGKLVAAYDHASVEKELGSTFYCRGIDVKGNFVGAAGGEYNAAKDCIAVVSPDGKTVRKVATPYAPQWTICPDAKRERWFFRACDDYTVQYAGPDGKAFRLLRDGTWNPLTASAGNRGKDEGINWSRGTTLPDGRYAGWSGSNCSPVFTATWLEDKP